jgi:hypothetical protein
MQKRRTEHEPRPIVGSARHGVIQGVMALTLTLMTTAANAQINDSTRWTGASYPNLGFAASWPDNWTISGAPSAATPRLIVQKNFEAGHPEEGAYCKVAVSPTPSTSAMTQDRLDADTKSKHPSDADVAAVLMRQGSTNPQVYNTGIYTVAGHPAVTYETATAKPLANGQTVFSYFLVASVSTPGKQYDVTCGSVTIRDMERAHMLFQLTSQAILRFLGATKIF